MSTFVAVNTYTHSVTYVTDKMLMLLKDIIRWSGLSPEKLASDWTVLHRGISTWLTTHDLDEVHLEVFNSKTGSLVGRWDFEIYYGSSGDGGGMWVNPEDVKYAIKKAGLWPSACDYRIVITNKPDRPNVEGWSGTTLRSTDGFVRQSIGTTIDGNGLRAGTTYWRAAK